MVLQFKLLAAVSDFFSYDHTYILFYITGRKLSNLKKILSQVTSCEYCAETESDTEVGKYTYTANIFLV